MAATLTFDTVVTSATTVGSPGLYTIPLTVASAAGEERLIFLCGIAASANADFSGVTVDGQAATQIGSDVRGPDAGGVAYLTAWRVAGTANTSIDVVATRSGTSDCYGAGVACYLLAGAGTVLATSSAITSDPSLAINTANNGAVAAAAHGFSVAAIAAAWTGLTERFDNRIYSDDVFSGASANITSASTPLAVSVVITPTLDVGVTDTFAAMAISFNPDAATSTDENLMDKSGMTTMGGMMG
jgi:hypothetical protein